MVLVTRSFPDILSLSRRLVWFCVSLHFPENLGIFFNLRRVGPYDSCFDHQQIDNPRIRHLVPEIADQIT
jgi:hypothetical protein